MARHAASPSRSACTSIELSECVGTKLRERQAEKPVGIGRGDPSSLEQLVGLGMAALVESIEPCDELSVPRQRASVTGIAAVREIREPLSIECAPIAAGELLWRARSRLSTGHGAAA